MYLLTIFYSRHGGYYSSEFLLIWENVVTYCCVLEKNNSNLVPIKLIIITVSGEVVIVHTNAIYSVGTTNGKFHSIEIYDRYFFVESILS